MTAFHVSSLQDSVQKIMTLRKALEEEKEKNVKLHEELEALRNEKRLL